MPIRSLLVAAFCALGALGTSCCCCCRCCRADEITDEMITSTDLSTTIKTLGGLTFMGKATPDDLAHDKAELRKKYWAFLPDSHLSQTRLAQENDRFETQWAHLVQASRDFEVTKTSFIGCDTLGLVKCLDMYYLSVTPNGPVLFRFSMEFEVEEHARFFGVETYTTWDSVKQITRGIQHPISPSRIPTVTWHPPHGSKPTTVPAGSKDE